MEHSYSNQPDPSVRQEIQQWLAARINQVIHIEKIEDGDTDQVQLQLEDIRLGRQNKHDPDDYVADEALLLYGSGCLETAGQQSLTANVPQHVYEIPMTPNMMAEDDQGRLLLSTDRAVYRLTDKQN